MVNICDINHFEDIDKYLSSISQILDTTPESIECQLPHAKAVGLAFPSG